MKNTSKELSAILSPYELNSGSDFQFFEKVPLSVLITDAKASIVYANRHFYKMTEYSRDDIIGENPRILSAGIHDSHFYRTMWSILQEKDIWVGELCNKKKSGKKYWEKNTIVAILDHRGEKELYIAYKEDITRERAVLQNLRIAKEEAEKANTAKSSFLANISHEIRTPMNAILGFSQLISRDESLTPQLRQNIGSIMSSGEHLLDLINDILDMAKIEAGKVELHLTDFSLPKFVNSLGEMMKIRATQKRLAFYVENVGSTPNRIISDQSFIRQILINFLSNAIKFTEKGFVILRIFTSLNQNNHTLLVFEVEDSGIGISPDETERIFENFVQAKGIARRSEGTGLGLAICNGLAKKLDGSISVRSELGKGSTFSFSMPVVEVQNPILISQVSDSKNQVGKMILNSELSGTRVLVVDDNHNDANFLLQMLSHMGFLVDVSFSGLDAIEKVRQIKPSVVFLDIEMPEVSGVEVIKRLAEEGKRGKLKIIAASECIDLKNRSNALKAGADDFLTKPILERSLTNALERVIGSDCFHTSGEEKAPITTREEKAGCIETIIAPEKLLALQEASIKLDIEMLHILINDLESKQGSQEVFDKMRKLVSGYKLDELLQMLSRGVSDELKD